MIPKSYSKDKRKGIIFFIVSIVIVGVTMALDVLTGLLSIFLGPDSWGIIILDILYFLIYLVAVAFMIVGLIYMFKAHDRLKKKKR